MPKLTEDPNPDDVTALWQSLVAATTAADHTLTAALLADLVRALSDTPAYLPGKTEYLLPLDDTSKPVALPSEMPAALRDRLKNTPILRPWFSTADCGGIPTILVARSLCHRIGLRHGTVQLILDHPTRPDYTFLQIRGFHKADAPGEFDMPCAGHTVACDTAEAALHKELTEEIGLTGDDLAELRCIGRYEHREITHRTDFINVELRTVYRARVKSQSMAKLHFADGEVAALTMITRTALPELASRYPDRIASGLGGTLPWYAE